MRRTIAGVLVLVAAVAWAGERVYGSGSSRSSACADAESRGRRVADQKNTCPRSCDPRQCTQESDGSYTCYVDIPNHKGSCP